MAGRHGSERYRRREQALAQARAVGVPDSCDVCVLGGGASGLVAAIAAAEAGARVVVLERDLACGRTILATGNGRCNFCNVKLEGSRYSQPKFVDEVCGERWLDDVLRFFRESGLRWSLEADRLYPISRQAASVRNVLLARARRAGVVLAPAREALSLERVACDGGGTSRACLWGVAYQGIWERAERSGLRASSVVLALGGGAVSHIASSLDLPLVSESPVLAPLACELSPLSKLDGRRVQVAATLWRGRLPLRVVRGEVLLRDYGLSGIAVFDLSRTAVAGDVVSLDLTPDLAASELAHLGDPARTGRFVDGAFDGVLDPQLAATLTELARSRWQLAGDERPNQSAPTSDTEAMVALVKGLPLRVSGIAHSELAQVTRGGLAVSCLAADTLGVAGRPGLFACGEALDVDADCGGFNLAWAWKSGMVAGEAAAAWGVEEAR